MKLIPLSVWTKNNGIKYTRAKDSSLTGVLQTVVQRVPITKIALMIPANAKNPWLSTQSRTLLRSAAKPQPLKPRVLSKVKPTSKLYEMEIDSD